MKKRCFPGTFFKWCPFTILFSALAFHPLVTVHALHQANGLYAGYFTGIKDIRGRFKEVSVNFTVPAIKPTLQHSVVSIWVGLGGVGQFTSPLELVQAGISIDWYPDQHRQVNTAWWEFIGKKSVPARAMNPALLIQAGDQIKVNVSSNLNNDEKDSFQVTNVTTGQNVIHQETDPSVLSDSAAAECVVEAPTINGSLALLASFSPITFTGCNILDDQNNIRPIGDFQNQQQDNLYRTDILDISKRLVTSTSPLKNRSTFTVTRIGLESILRTGKLRTSSRRKSL